MMRIGVMMHVTDTTATVAELAREAESRGFESVFVTEPTHIPVRSFIPWRDGQPMPESYKRLYDPIVGLATTAAATTTVTRALSLRRELVREIGRRPYFFLYRTEQVLDARASA